MKNLAARPDHDSSMTIISFTQALCIAVLTALVQLYIVFHDFDKLQRLGEKKMEFPGKAGSAGTRGAQES